MNSIANDLKLLGISGRESRVYIALLENIELKASEIAATCSISQSKIYGILKNLVEKKMCIEFFKNGTKIYKVVEPKIVLQNILSSYEEELRIKSSIALEFEKNLTLIYRDNSKRVKKISNFFEVVTDPEQLRQKYISIETNTRREIVSFSKSPYVLDLKENIEIVDKNFRQIENRCVYESKEIHTAEEKDFFVKMIQTYIEMGEKARIVRELPMKLFVSDETITVISLNDSYSQNSDLMSIIIDHPTFAIAQKQIFESYWNMGVTLEEYNKEFLQRKEAST